MLHSWCLRVGETRETGGERRPADGGRVERGGVEGLSLRGGSQP